MIREEFVTYSIAKLLREKGFNEPCDYQYEVCDPERGAAMYNITDRSRYPQYYIDAPTQAMTMRWLREIHGIIIVILTDFTDDTLTFFYRTDTLNGYGPKHMDIFYNTYEEACEAAIRYTLENLI